MLHEYPSPGLFLHKNFLYVVRTNPLCLTWLNIPGTGKQKEASTMVWCMSLQIPVELGWNAQTAHQHGSCKWKSSLINPGNTAFSHKGHCFIMLLAYEIWVPKTGDPPLLTSARCLSEVSQIFLFHRTSSSLHRLVGNEHKAMLPLVKCPLGILCYYLWRHELVRWTEIKFCVTKCKVIQAGGIMTAFQAPKGSKLTVSVSQSDPGGTTELNRQSKTLTRH